MKYFILILFTSIIFCEAFSQKLPLTAIVNNIYKNHSFGSDKVLCILNECALWVDTTSDNKNVIKLIFLKNEKALKDIVNEQKKMEYLLQFYILSVSPSVLRIKFFILKIEKAYFESPSFAVLYDEKTIECRFLKNQWRFS